jgi:hypothetical protein
MTIKRKLKSWRDTTHFAAIRKSRLDRSGEANKKRMKAKALYRRNKSKIKVKSKQRRLKMTPMEKLFNTKRAGFLKTHTPKLPPRPGAPRKSIFKPAVKTIKRAIKPIKRAIKTVTKSVKRTGIKGR